MDLQQDIFFNDFAFSFREYDLDNGTKCRGWFLVFNTEVKLDGNYGPFATREEVIAIVPYIESKMEEAREKHDEADADADDEADDEKEQEQEEEDVEQKMKVLLDAAMNIINPLGNAPPPGAPGNAPPQVPILPLFQMLQNLGPPPNLNNPNQNG